MGLYVTVGPGERVSTSSTTLRITDLYENYVAGTDVDVDWAIDFGASGWQKKNYSLLRWTPASFPKVRMQRWEI